MRRATCRWRSKVPVASELRMDANNRQAVALETLGAWCSEPLHFSSGAVRQRSQAGAAARPSGAHQGRRAPAGDHDGASTSSVDAKSGTGVGALQHGARQTSVVLHAFSGRATACKGMRVPTRHTGDSDRRFGGCVHAAVPSCLHRNGGPSMSLHCKSISDFDTGADSRQCMTLREQQAQNLRTALIAHQQVCSVALRWLLAMQAAQPAL